MHRLLWVSENLSHYRIPLYEELAKEVNLTICHGSDLVKNVSFSQIKLDQKKLGKFKWINLKNTNRYDSIILPFDLSILNLYWKDRSVTPKKGVFGIGVRASYKNKYDSSLIDSLFRKYILNLMDFGIFYSDYPRIKYEGLGINPCKLYVAENTVQSNPNFKIERKKYNSFLFIGSLYKEKGVMTLIKAYRQLLNEDSQLNELIIIGDGPERNRIIEETRGIDKIKVLGPIYSSEELLEFFLDAAVVISPNQAGLSVLEAFSYAVGFITQKQAITGGERFNIIHDYNGSFFDKGDSDLKELMKKYRNKEYAAKIGNNAYEYYQNHRTIKQWVDEILKAVL